MNIGFRCPRCEKSFYLDERHICKDEEGNCCCPLCNNKRDKGDEIDG